MYFMCVYFVAKNIISRMRAITRQIRQAERELATLYDTKTVIIDEKIMTFTFQTTTGITKYSPAVQKLYYTLLANQIPPAKIADIISVKMFFATLRHYKTNLT